MSRESRVSMESITSRLRRCNLFNLPLKKIPTFVCIQISPTHAVTPLKDQQITGIVISKIESNLLSISLIYQSLLTIHRCNKLTCVTNCQTRRYFKINLIKYKNLIEILEKKKKLLLVDIYDSACVTATLS